MDFEWNPQKAEINHNKHGISFDEATTVFGDTLSITYLDPDHSIQEEWFVMLGLSSKHRILVISHRYHGETVRIISARLATKRERRFYEHGN
ncbi:MAG: BrnT family toxin [Thioploca sp.]|nr:BrnT family toxin [Thioploca sp.]